MISTGNLILVNISHLIFSDSRLIKLLTYCYSTKIVLFFYSIHSKPKNTNCTTSKKNRVKQQIIS